MQWLLIAAGGALGAVSRYALDRAVIGVIGPTVIGTFAINITGSFVLGMLVSLMVERDGSWMAHVRPLAGVGFLGAYTTFSTWTVASVQMVENGEIARAVFNIFGSIAIGLLAAYIGLLVGRALWLN